MDRKGDFTIKNEAKEAEFRQLFGELADKQQDSILGIEREFAAQTRPDSAPCPPHNLQPEHP